MAWDDILKGSNGADIISGGNGDDFIQGRAGNDVLNGDDGNDTLHGDAGDDHLRGGRGNDFIHGGIGTDTAYYSGSIVEYSHSIDGENLYINHIGGSMIDGYDRLLHVERLVFADAVIDLTQNNAPFAFNDLAATHEDVGIYSGSSVLANDFDWEGDSLSVTPATIDGTYGQLVLNANGTYTYSPFASTQALAQGQIVQDSFTYTVSDGSLSDTGTLTISVSGNNDAPVANPDTASTGENASVTVDVRANDSDVDNGAVLTVTAASAPAGQGSASVVANQVVFNPGTDFDYLDTGETAQVVVGYTISDEHGATSSSTVTITVNGANDAPVANDDTASTSEDASVAGNVLANDTDVDGETLTVANPGVYAGAYGTLTLNADGSYSYAPNAAAQGLDDGESAQNVFSYTASDGTASDTATLTVTVDGANDAPVANDDSASTNENNTVVGVSGNVLANDTDADGEPLTVANPGTYLGTYGTLTLAADGSYTYTPGAGAQPLDVGETAQDVFTYTASDGTASDTANLTVTITGLNDPPVANDDVNATDENSPVSGNVLANDTDVDVEPLIVSTPGTYNGFWGTLVLAANGSYTYTPNAIAALLNNGQSVVDVFGYNASDGTASDSATLTITINGLSGVPNAVEDTASTSEDNSVSGNVLANDTDPENDPLTVSNPGTHLGTYGDLVLNADGSYTYTPYAAANGMAAGEVVQDVFTYTATDGGASDTATLTVIVNGTNDAPTITGGDFEGSVTELPDGDPDEGDIDHSTSGVVTFDDVDVTDTPTASFTQGAGYYGTFTLDQTGESVGWEFTVSDAALENLSEDQEVTQVYTITIDDGHGGTVTQDVTITINGTGVGTGPQTVWYIDNSAVGSANLGTSADPFTSIAAFNAAQGTLAGPQVGHTVHLLAGLGTYTEADGINLLNGQTLIGDADGALRPTIVATAGDGIDVAENNDISGIDIGSTSGAGIDDDGGTVGTLTVTDVGIGGVRTGQIVDIDNGGILNVTLNEASSTGSTGGAIDLAGVGGSFTIAGATTITGLHAGGGVEVTGSAATVTLNGGTISTGANTAVNYVGNSGALALDGGLDIVTTGGAGLNAAGGGTVTVTGADSTVASTTGTAVTISGTTIGAGGVTFESVSSAGAVNTIVLTSTGSLAGLTVTGTGAAGSGGTIAGSTGAAILVVDTMDLDLSSLSVTGSAGDVLNATNLRGDSALSDSVISGFGTAGGNTANAVRIVNNNVDLASFTLDGSTISGGATANDGLFMEAQGTSDMRLFVQNSTFSGLFGDGVQVSSALTSTGDVNVTVEDSDFVNAAVAGNGGLALTTTGGATLRALVEGNTFDDIMRPNSNGGAISLANSGTATAHVSIVDNVIEDLPGARGITSTSDGNSISYLLIDGNSIDRLGINNKLAINVTLNNNAVGDVTITDNQIGQNGNLWTAGTGTANAVSVLSQNNSQVDLLLDGNAVTANTSFEAIRIRSINTAVMNATVTDNVLLDSAGAHLEFDATAGAAAGTSVLNLNIFSNDLPNAGVGVIRLNDLAGGVLNVTQTSAADVSAVNDAATVTVLGSVIFAQPAPPLPVVPEFPM